MSSFVKKKTPYQFWNYRDMRKKKPTKLRSPELPNIQTDLLFPVKGFISHHILLPHKELPKALVERFKVDLSLPNPMFQKSLKYGKGFVSYAIPEFLRFYNIDEEYMALPRSTKMAYLEKRFKECGLKLELEDIRPKFEKVEFKIREDMHPLFYQEEAIKNIVEKNCVIKLRCGKGKTLLFLFAAAKIGLRTLVLVRTNILIKQWVESIKKIFDISDSDIGIINGDSKTEGKITVATEQSLVSLTRDEKRALGERYGMIAFDEAHETPAEQYSELMQYFKSIRIIGLSATPFREDHLDPVLKLYIGPIVEIDDLGDFTTSVHIHKTQFTYHFERRKDQYHRLVEALINDDDRNRLIIQDIKEMAERDLVIVCYSNRIRHMEILQDMLTKEMPAIKSDILASDVRGQSMTPDRQEEIKNELKDGKIQVLFGGKIVEQGFDCPPLSVAILATPTKSRRLVEQVMGRCQREYPGKKEAVLIDYLDENCKVLKYQFFSKNKRFYKNYRKEWL